MPLAVFSTLTFSDEYLPFGDKFPERGSLDKSVLRDFFKRISARFEYKMGYPLPKNYYAVGEYGRTTFRAHYHILFYGLHEALVKDLLEHCWSFGSVRVESAVTPNDFTTDNPSSLFNRINYVAKHNIRSKTHLSNLHEGQAPEFPSRSRRPALGHIALPHFALNLKSRKLFPVRGLSRYSKYLLANDSRFSNVVTCDWSGGFKMNSDFNIYADYTRSADNPSPSFKNFKGGYYRLDKYAMTLLARLVDDAVFDALMHIEDIEPPPMDFADYILDDIAESTARFKEYNNSPEHIHAIKTSARSLRKMVNLNTRTKRV